MTYLTAKEMAKKLRESLKTGIMCEYRDQASWGPMLRDTRIRASMLEGIPMIALDGFAWYRRFRINGEDYEVRG